RHEARERAFQILFALDINDIEIDIKNDDPYLEIVTRGVIENIEKIDLLIGTNLENWALERLPYAERTILRIATYELEYLDDIPMNVSINEAIELAHKYGDNKLAKLLMVIFSKLLKKRRYLNVKQSY